MIVTSFKTGEVMAKGVANVKIGIQRLNLGIGIPVHSLHARPWCLLFYVTGFLNNMKESVVECLLKMFTPFVKIFFK